VTQKDVRLIVEKYYADKIQSVTFLDDDSINCVLYKSSDEGLNTFKGFSFPLHGIVVDTESAVRNILDMVIQQNETWYGSN
jgi:hypothetical protein